jgi:hypothetical protein
MLDREANETPSNSNSPRANKLIIKLTFVSSTYTITRGASRPGQTQEAKARVEKCKKKNQEETTAIKDPKASKK